MKIILSVFLFLLCFAGRKPDAAKPYKCSFYPKDTSGFKKFYNNQVKYMGIQKGEKVASIGAQNGPFEMQMASFIDSVSWTIQDIDSTYTNAVELEKVRAYYEGLLHRKISGRFEPVVGTESQTALPASTYDRVLLLNVYHELTQPEAMLRDMHRILKTGGQLVVYERVTDKRGKIRKDCNHVMPLRQELIQSFENARFKTVSQRVDRKWADILIFEKI